jgi:CheY-like chemotaxis protein
VPEFKVPARRQPDADDTVAMVSTERQIAPVSGEGSRVAELAEALHEVSNALTVILGWIERARTEGRAAGTPEPVDRALDVASTRAAQARDLVRRAIGAEVASAAPRLASVVVAEAVIGLDPEAQRAAIDLEVVTDRAVATLTVDHAPSIIQILTNLILNAISVSPRETKVTIDIGLGPSGSIVFGVADEGPGIPFERRATLFTSGVSTRPGGAGIGLRHAAGLARGAGGDLSLAPSARGARFELRWPLAGGAPTSTPVLSVDEAPHAATPARSGPSPMRGHVGPTLVSAGSTPASRPESPPGARLDGTSASRVNGRPASRLDGAPLRPPPSRPVDLGGARILLVEDDEAVIDLLDTALTARGAEVVSIRHHGELAPALASGPYDVALLDISPIRDDIEGVLLRVRASAVSAPRVVLISGSAVQMPSLPTGWVAAWVRKPFEMSELIHVLSARGTEKL